MKLFTDPQGKFQFFIPVQWQYKNPRFRDERPQPHAFGDYDNMVGGFQISCKPINEHIAEVILKNRLPIHRHGKGKIKFNERFFDIEGKESYIWMAAVEDHFVLATYIYDKKEKAEATTELDNIRKSFEDFKFIMPEYRGHVLALRRYDLFMYSMASLLELRNKAMENGSFVELVVATANLIDASLRLAIILTRQLEEKSDQIDTSLFYQGEKDKAVMERTIYKMALDEGIINQKLFDRLELLYKERNKVVHRYIITDIRTEQVIEIALHYFELEEQIDKIVHDLETAQFQQQIGLNKYLEPGKLSDSQMEVLKASIRDKHGEITWQATDEELDDEDD